MTDFKQWEGFEGRIWKEEVNTRDFIQKNYTPYDGDESFLAGPTDATNKLWGALQKLQKEEMVGYVKYNWFHKEQHKPFKEHDSCLRTFYFLIILRFPLQIHFIQMTVLYG